MLTVSRWQETTQLLSGTKRVRCGRTSKEKSPRRKSRAFFSFYFRRTSRARCLSMLRVKKLASAPGAGVRYQSSINAARHPTSDAKKHLSSTPVWCRTSHLSPMLSIQEAGPRARFRSSDSWKQAFVRPYPLLEAVRLHYLRRQANGFAVSAYIWFPMTWDHAWLCGRELST
jgi:hypothetical protein